MPGLCRAKAIWLEVVNLESKDKNSQGKNAEDSKRMPADSIFYDKLVPVILIALAVLMVIVILAAAGILLGIVPV